MLDDFPHRHPSHPPRQPGDRAGAARHRAVSWLELAACRGRPTRWWYPATGDSFGAQVAVLICRSCPVRVACLAAALAEEVGEGGTFGVRGGYTAEQRRRMPHPQPVRYPVATPRVLTGELGRITAPARNDAFTRSEVLAVRAG